MLWINLIMDSLASLALATEPPDDSLLQRPPVHRSQSIITEQMWYSMIGHAVYQLVLMLFILFNADYFPSRNGGWLLAGHRHSREDRGEDVSEPSEHYTFLFTAFVCLQLFNEINCRKLHGEWNVFNGMLRNPLFIGIWVVTCVIQVAMTQYGGRAIRVCSGGLSRQQWYYCICIGCTELFVQQIINMLCKIGLQLGLDSVVKRGAVRTEVVVSRVSHAHA